MDHAQPSAPPASMSNHNVVVTSPPANMVAQLESKGVASMDALATSSADSVPSLSSILLPQTSQFENTQAVHQLPYSANESSSAQSPNLPMAHSTTSQNIHIMGASSKPHSGIYNMTSMQRALPAVTVSASVHTVVYSSAPPSLTAPPVTIPTHPRHLHNRHQTGASPAAVAYQLSQQIQQQYQGGATAGATFVQGTESQIYYANANSPYQHIAGVYHDQYGRSYSVPNHTHDPGASTIVHPQNGSSPVYPVPSYSANYSPYAPPPQIWYASPGQHPQPTPYVYVATPPPVAGYPIVPGPSGSVPQFQFDHNQDSQRRHSVPIRPASMQNRTLNFRAPTGPGLHPPPSTAQRQPGEHRGPIATHKPTLTMACSGSHHSPATSSSSTISSGLPRGPPRKPKQSGFAVWVGNLPVGVSVIDVKDHFSKDLKNEIQSVKMMSKTDCAFINYRSEQAANEALAKFNESRFHGKKLVVRARRTISEQNSGQASGDEDGDGSGTSSGVSQTKSPPIGPAGARPKINAKDRYFIIKSLTVEDLEMSVKTGVWATQSENERKLNQAFEVRVSSKVSDGEDYMRVRNLARGWPEPEN